MDDQQLATDNDGSERPEKINNQQEMDLVKIRTATTLDGGSNGTTAVGGGARRHEIKNIKRAAPVAAARIDGLASIPNSTMAEAQDC